MPAIPDHLKDFQWRDAQGSFHVPKDMETHHVFFSWLMVWNHTCPTEMRVWWNDPNPRTFSSFYTEKYMQNALAVFTHELQLRKDMTERQLAIWQKVVGSCVGLAKGVQG